MARAAASARTGRPGRLERRRWRLRPRHGGPAGRRATASASGTQHRVGAPTGHALLSASKRGFPRERAPVYSRHCVEQPGTRRRLGPSWRPPSGGPSPGGCSPGSSSVCYFPPRRRGPTRSRRRSRSTPSSSRRPTGSACSSGCRSRRCGTSSSRSRTARSSTSPGRAAARDGRAALGGGRAGGLRERPAPPGAAYAPRPGGAAVRAGLLRLRRPRSRR
jgi:hypothetical protein